MKQSKATATDTFFQLKDTDVVFPKQWRSGSLKYDDFESLTEGGTAKLLTCLDENLRRVVVYKTLHAHLLDNEIETQRFLREARVTANIQHPGTVPVYELGRDRKGNLFFTMKRIEGRDLRKLLEDIKAEIPDTSELFPLPRLIDVLIDVCQTVAYAHAHGVIHRDLKPANIIVGEFGEVMLLDWGLAKIMGEPNPAETDAVQVTDEPGLTPVGRRYGTPLYMSPEIARGDADIDGRSDVFTMGIILYEILTRKQMLHGENAWDVAETLLNKPIPLPSNVAPELQIPRELEAICLKALRLERENRYPDMKALLDDLQHYRLGGEVSVYQYSGIERLNRWNHRHALTLTAVFAGIAGFAFHWLLSR